MQKTKSDKNQAKYSRRQFIETAATTAAVFSIVPSHVLGGPGQTAPSDKITAAVIGVGGQGIGDMRRLMSFDDAQVVSVADPVKKWDTSMWWYGGFSGHDPARDVCNAHYAEKSGNPDYKACRTYFDFRDMLEKEDVDAVLVASTDNTHAVAAMAALKKGKHVYCEKPLTYTVKEARLLAAEAKKQGVATQMGNNGQAGERPRRLAEMIADGCIGNISEVHRWTNRPIWKQGMVKPAGTPPVPETIDWDLWVGPAQMRPYHPDYVSVGWRGWVDFGTGALGDMGCHEFYPIFRSLKLGHPTSIEASYANTEGTMHGIKDSWPVASTVKYEFPARAGMPPVTVTWYDGGLKPPRPSDYEDGREWRNQGVLFMGDKGNLVNGRIVPETKMQSYTPPPKTLPRSPGHMDEWIRAIKGGEPGGSEFGYASMVTEVVLLGNIALRTGKRLEWDAENMTITNDIEANALLHREYREGWTL